MRTQIIRREALRHCALFERSDYRILTVTAQAGQGKTILVSQFDAATPVPFAWTTCTSKDSTPRFLFENVLLSIQNVLPAMSKKDIQAPLRQQLTTDEYIRIASDLVGRAFRDLNEPLMLVFDDVHLLENSPPTLRLLRRLVETAPGNIRFIFISRRRVLLDDGSPLFAPRETMQIDRALLAFNREEISQLYNEVFNSPTNTETINMLLEATEGWIFGLKLLHANNSVRSLKATTGLAALGGYFDELLAPAFPEASRRSMSLVAYFDELPQPLVTELFPADVLTWLRNMAAQKCFVRCSTLCGVPVYRLHHLLQDYLRHEAERDHSREELSDFQESAGRWHAHNGNVIEGMRCYAKAEAWSLISDSLRQHGTELLGDNRHYELMELLSGIPESARTRHGWICLYLGIVAMALSAPGSGELLQQSLGIFETEKDRLGELLAMCRVLEHKVVIGGDFTRQERVLSRAAELFAQEGNALSGRAAACCLQTLAISKAYLEGRLAEAKAYLRLAWHRQGRTTTHEDIQSIVARTLVYGLEGDITRTLKELSPLLGMLWSPWLSPTNKTTLRFMHLNYQLMAGNFRAYEAAKTELKSHWGTVFETSFLSDFIVIWDLDKLMNDGHYEEVRKQAHAHRHTSRQLTPHMRSQFLHYEMLAHAHLGQFDRMHECLRQALRERHRAGGTYFIHLTRCFVGAALSLEGKDSAAKRVFAACEKLIPDGTFAYHTPTIHAYRAALHLRQGRLDAAREDITALFEELNRFGNAHSFGLSPLILKAILPFAVTHKIHAAHARAMARKKLFYDILDDGTLVPQLHIRNVGELRISIGGGPLMDWNIPPQARKIIRLACLSSNRTARIRELQAALWPEEAPEHSRSKFDTNLSRLRQSLSAALGQQAGKYYIRTERQRVCLAHCTVDSDAIVEYAMRGIQLAREDSPWQAHVAFEAMVHWIGRPLAASWQRLSLPEEIGGTVRRALAAWAELLVSCNMQQQALYVTERSLEIDPIDDAMQRLRYNTLIALKRPADAALALKQYRKHLAEYSFSEEELDDIVDNLLAGRNQPPTGRQAPFSIPER